MNPIYPNIENYLEIPSQGALLITGTWGSGKTYYVKNELIPKIQGDKKHKPVLISLFGIKDRTELSQKILFSLWDKSITGKSTTSRQGDKTLIEIIKNVSKKIPCIKKYTSFIDKFLNINDLTYKMIPSNVLLILDDVERLNKSFLDEDFWGFINELIENKGIKIILIANKEKIPPIEHEEKVIEKTLHFQPLLEDVYKAIIKDFKDKTFSEHLSESIVKKYLIDLPIKNNGIKNDLSNIRTLKFALKHYHEIFKIFVQERDDLSNEAIQQKINFIWTFCLAISVEFKKNEITDTNYRGLDQYIETSTLADDVSLFDDIAEGKNDQFETQIYPKELVKRFFSPYKVPYYFNLQIYNFITTGTPLDPHLLKNELDILFYTQKNKIKPAKALLERFMNGYCSFSNEEFVENLKKLLTFVEQGDFEDYPSYMNAGIYLLGFADMYTDNEQDVIQKLHKGIDSFTSRTEIDIITPVMFDTMLSHINQMLPEIKEFHSYIKTKIHQKIKENEQQEISRVKELFQNDMESLYKYFLPNENGVLLSSESILQNIDKTAIEDRMKNISPNEIQLLANIIEVRHLQRGLEDRLQPEITFLQNLKKTISDMNTEEKILSNHIIKTSLSPKLEIAIQRLEKHSSSQEIVQTNNPTN